MLSGQLFRSHLRMGSRIRMDHQALHISHIGKKGEYFERIDKLPGRFLSAFDLESKNTSGLEEADGSLWLLSDVRTNT